LLFSQNPPFLTQVSLKKSSLSTHLAFCSALDQLASLQENKILEYLDLPFTIALFTVIAIPMTESTATVMSFAKAVALFHLTFLVTFVLLFKPWLLSQFLKISHCKGF